MLQDKHTCSPGRKVLLMVCFPSWQLARACVRHAVLCCLTVGCFFAIAQRLPIALPPSQRLTTKNFVCFLIRNFTVLARLFELVYDLLVFMALMAHVSTETIMVVLGFVLV